MNINESHMKYSTTVKVFWLKGMSTVQKGCAWSKRRKCKNRGVCILSPNLVTDEGQSLLMVVTELPELIWSPMALSKLKWEVMKEKRREEKRPFKKSTQIVCATFTYFLLALKISSPTCKPSKIPHTLRATCEKASPVAHSPDSSVKSLAHNLWDSHIWKGWARMCFKLRQGLIQTRPDSLLCSEHKVSTA